MTTVPHMNFESASIESQNISAIEKLFPSCITEVLDEEKSTKENKVYKHAVDFEKLKSLLGGDVAEGDEAYEFTWVGKKAAIKEAATPVRKTLRPCKEESKNWDTTENLYIEGDNLDVLKMLQESYLGKVKMIYIDPPYNTGNDFIYNDSFEMDKDEYNEGTGAVDDDDNKNFSQNNDSNPRFHSDWCSMIYPRLALARNLLTDDGVIFISIDDNEQSNLKKICDEVFGEENFVAQIIIASNSSKNNSKYVSITHEYILCYAKCKLTLGKDWTVSRNNLNEYKNRISALIKAGLTNEEIRKELLALTKFPRFYEFDHYTHIDKKGVFRVSDLTAPSSKNFYDVIHNKTNKTCKTGIRGWAYSQEAMQKLIDDDMIFWGDDETIMPQLKNYLNENDTTLPKSVLFFDSQSSTKWLKAENLPFDFAKSTELLKYLLETCTSEKDLILDFFSGSATTAHAVMKLNAEDGGNRKFIMVQLPEVCDEKSEAYKAGYKTICEIGKERIRRAGEKILTEWKEKKTKEDESLIKSEKAMTEPDIGFRVFKADSTNMKDVYYTPAEYSQDLLKGLESNIKEDRTDMDLLSACLLDWGLELSLPYSSEQIEGVTVHTVNNGDLIACFAEKVPESVVHTIAERKPMRVVFRDSSFADTPTKINVLEIFKTVSPNTSVKVM